MQIKVKLSNKVNKTGGTYGAGSINQMSLITYGQAKGHNLWIDEYFLGQLASELAKKPSGLKTNYKHSSLFNDSTGRLLGKIINTRLQGDQVLGDLSFAESSKKTPQGDLADYILTMAQETPQFFGASIEFEFNLQQMQKFVLDAGGQMRVFEGKIQTKNFISPDANNVNNYAHARLKSVNACAIVSDPAANPNGIFATQFSSIDKEIKIIANIIKEELDNKKHYGLLKELKKMNINLEKAVVVEQKSVEQTETVINGESQIVNKEQTIIVTMQESPTQFIVETTTVQKQAIQKPVQPAIVDSTVQQELSKKQQTVKMLSAKDSQIQAMKATIAMLQAKFAKQEELFKFAKGASPVAPSVEKEVKLGLKEKIDGQLKKLNIK